MESLGKGKVVAITCSKHYKKLRPNSDSTVNEELSYIEFTNLRSKVFQEFGLQVFDVFKMEDAEALCDLVISYFS